MTICSPQDHIIELLRLGGNWNNFSGERVASALEENRNAWRAAYPTCEAFPGYLDIRPQGVQDRVNLLPLRQLAEGHFGPDTLFILPSSEGHNVIERLATNWSADEVGWLDFDSICRSMRVNRKSHPDMFPDRARAVLRVWWD